MVLYCLFSLKTYENPDFLDIQGNEPVRKKSKPKYILSDTGLCPQCFALSLIPLFNPWQQPPFITAQMYYIEIAQAGLAHIGLLQTIAIQTFCETFSDVNSEENMKKYLEDSFSIGKLSAELGDENSKFYFARSGNNVIGYLKLNTGQSQTEMKKANAVEIERIYVLKDFHGKKAGQLLYEKALQIARQLNAEYIWLGVWEHNPRAIRFYTKNGFEAFDRHIFILGDDRQTDILMKKILTKETDI